MAKPNFNESHPTLLHPSADDSQIFDQHLNGMSQNGKCLVNVLVIAGMWSFLVQSLVIAGMWSFLVQSNQSKDRSLAEN